MDVSVHQQLFDERFRFLYGKKCLPVCDEGKKRIEVILHSLVAHSYHPENRMQRLETCFSQPCHFFPSLSISSIFNTPHITTCENGIEHWKLKRNEKRAWRSVHGELRHNPYNQSYVVEGCILACEENLRSIAGGRTPYYGPQNGMRLPGGFPHYSDRCRKHHQ